MRLKILLQLRKGSDILFIIMFFQIILGCSATRIFDCEKEMSFVHNDTIEVVYSPVLVESPVGVGHHHLKSYVFPKADTIYLKKCDFLELASCLNRFKTVTSHDDCNPRYYIKYGNKDVFLKENPLYSCDNKKTPFFKNKYALYLLLNKCLFYNHIPIEELKWNSLIRQYGIPKDYKYIPLYDSANTTYYYWRKQNGSHGFLRTVLILEQNK